MTGRELILYILQNHLEDKPVIKDGKLIGFLTVAEVASMFDVGTATVQTWIDLGCIKAVRIGSAMYIPDIYERRAEQ